MGRSPLYPTNPKACLVCGEVLVRKQREQTAHFAQRKTCGYACAQRQKWQERRELRPLDPPKTCAYCGNLFARRQDELKTAWQRRQTCNRSCRSQKTGEEQKRRLYGNDMDRLRFCLACGLQLTRRSRESFATFWQRKTCDQTCGTAYVCRIRQRGGPRKSPYPVHWRGMREAIRRRDGYACRVCGASRGSRRLPVHHIDYDRQNCTPTNLVTLCQTCHNRTTKGDRTAWLTFFAEMMQEK